MPTEKELLALLKEIYDEVEGYWPEFRLITSKATRDRLKTVVKPTRRTIG
jgi:hypothetical protein